DRQPAAETEADRADALAFEALERAQVFGRAAHLVLDLVHRHRHHQLLRRVGLLRRLAAVEVGREREEPLACEAIADGADVLVDAPPLLQHDRRPPPLAVRNRKVSGLAPRACLKLDVGHLESSFDVVATRAAVHPYTSERALRVSQAAMGCAPRATARDATRRTPRPARRSRSPP